MKGALQEKGAQTPFVMVDLKDFVPHWAHGQNKEAEPSKHLKMAQWGPAFDRAAIALAWPMGAGIGDGAQGQLPAGLHGV